LDGRRVVAGVAGPTPRVQWITEAKGPETRARRVAGTLDRLRADEEPAT
jgi:hypothetical protein